MIDNLGNIWVEPDYEGYGEFGGKDIHVLFAEMNDIETQRNPDEDDEDYMQRRRTAGIEAWDSDENYDKEYIYPNLVENCDAEWSNKKPCTCPHQGYFYSLKK